MGALVWEEQAGKKETAAAAEKEESGLQNCTAAGRQVEYIIMR